MFCPKCRAEYRRGFDRCADCDLALVESLSELPGNSGGELVPVLQTTDPALLPMAKSVLDAASIPYIVQGEAGVNVFPLGAAATRVTGRLTGAVILVRKDCYEEAKALLEFPAEEETDT